MRNSATPAAYNLAVAAIMATVPPVVLTPAEELALGQRAFEVIQTADPKWSTDQLMTELAIELFVPDELVGPALVSYLRSNPAPLAVA